MQLLILLSALLTALSGVVGGRAEAPQPVVAASAVAATVVTAAAPAAIAVLGALVAFVLHALPLPRAFALGPAVAIYRGRRRE